MRATIITLRFSETLGAFDTTPLDEFSRARQLTDLREHFFLADGVPYLACVIHYLEEPVPHSPTARADHRSSTNGSERRRPSHKPDPCAGLSEQDRATFQSLRAWRSDRAKSDGLSHFLILTNKQALELIRKRPGSRTALSQIDGIGKSKVEKYADELLALLAPAGNPVAVTAT